MSVVPMPDFIFRIIHEVFTIIWVGGMILYLFVLLPTFRSAIPKNSERKKLVQKLNDNLAFLMLISIMTLFITGLIIIPGGHDDPIFLTFVNKYATYLTIKTYLSFLMFIIVVLRLSVIDRIKIPSKKHFYIQSALFLNILLAIIIIVISIYIRYLNN